MHSSGPISGYGHDGPNAMFSSRSKSRNTYVLYVKISVSPSAIPSW